MKPWFADRAGWAGRSEAQRHVHGTIRAPVAGVSERWLTVRSRVAGEGELRPSGERGRLRTRSPGPRPLTALADARASGSGGHGRGRGRGPLLGAARPTGHGQLVSARQPAGCTQQPGAGCAARSGGSDPDHLLRAGRRRARRQTAAALAAHTRPVAPAGQSHAPLRPVGLRRPLRLRAAARPSAKRRRRGAFGGRPGDDPPDRLDGAARLHAPPAAAPRAGRLPPARLDAVRRPGRAHAARRASGRCRRRRRAASAGAIRTPRASCRRSGARAARTRSRAAP